MKSKALAEGLVLLAVLMWDDTHTTPEFVCILDRVKVFSRQLALHGKLLFLEKGNLRQVVSDILVGFFD